MYEVCPSCQRSRPTMRVFDNGSKHCHACGYHVNPNQEERTHMKLPVLEPFDWGSRKLTPRSLDLYGVGLDENERVVSPHYSPTMELLALHSRSPGERDFRMKGSNVPFGLQHLGSNASLIICEGHTDTLSAKQMFPACDVIGVPGSNTVSTLANYRSYLNKYKTITLMFDGDAAGEKATEELLKLLPASKTRVTSLRTGYDVNRYLVEGLEDELIQAYKNSAKQESDIFVTDTDCEGYAESVDSNTIKTGIKSLDRMFGGFGVGDLSIITGYTGTGKSALSQMLSVNAAKAGVKVLYLAGEMTPKQNLHRLAKQWVGGVLRKDEVVEVYKKVKDSILIYKGSDFSIENVCATISRAVEDHDVKLVVVDVLSDIEGFNDDYKVAASTIKRLHHIAKGDDLEGIPDCAIVCVAHTKGADDGPVSLNSMRGGSAIKQDASLVVGFNEEEQGNHRNTNRIVTLLKKPRLREFVADDVKLTYNPLNGHYSGADEDETTTDKVRLKVRGRVSQEEPTPTASPSDEVRLGVSTTTEALPSNQGSVEHGVTTKPIGISPTLRTGLLVSEGTNGNRDEGTAKSSRQDEATASSNDASRQTVQAGGINVLPANGTNTISTATKKPASGIRSKLLETLKRMYEEHPEVLREHQAIQTSNNTIRRNLIDLGLTAS